MRLSVAAWVLREAARDALAAGDFVLASRVAARAQRLQITGEGGALCLLSAWLGARGGVEEREAQTMGSLDWSQCPAVESIPGKRSGAWVFRDTRTPGTVVFDNLEVGASISEIMDWFHLSHEQVVAVIEFAARSLDAPPSPRKPAQAVDAHTL